MSSSGLKMLNEGEKNEAEVTFQDQVNINNFSKLNIRLDNLNDLITAKKTEKEYLDDLSGELELADEDEPVRYRIGDCFISMSLEKAQERIEADQNILTEELSIQLDEADSINKEMAKLKALLYGKFGNNINLEKD